MSTTPRSDAEYEAMADAFERGEFAISGPVTVRESGGEYLTWANRTGHGSNEHGVSES